MVEVIETFESRLGWHPCDYATYKKLKKLNYMLHLNKQQYSKHTRWLRKRSWNRILWKKIKDANNRPIGWQNLGPAPEPKFFIFSLKEQQEILTSYTRARMPKKSKDEVRPLTLSIDQINALLSRSEKELEGIEQQNKEIKNLLRN